MPEPAKLEIAPPVAVISPIAKLEEDSLRVKVTVAVWPDFKAEVEELIVMVGAVVSARAMVWSVPVNPDEAKVSV